MRNMQEKAVIHVFIRRNTVDEYTGQMDEFVSGQYALDSQAEQDQCG